VADNGTLFLDEVGDITVALQPKLLRVLQEQSLSAWGATRTHQVNVRLGGCATHRNLVEMVKRNEFRSDLYYRLNVFSHPAAAGCESAAKTFPALVNSMSRFMRAG